MWTGIVRQDACEPGIILIISGHCHKNKIHFLALTLFILKTRGGDRHRLTFVHCVIGHIVGDSCVSL